ncbi:MAG: hypothetical protein HYX34_14485 [Actinobacteria bacterium]|nr:hypothetical protein [Actinomycetota bacterium]
MRLSTPVLDVVGDRLVVAATVETDGPVALPASRVSLAAPAALAGAIDTTVNPLLPVATLAAALAGEDLHVEGPADDRTAAAAAAAVARLDAWWGWRAPRVDVAQPEARPHPPARGGGLFFTRGVDSWWSLLRLRDDEPGWVTHLVALRGVDVGWSEATQAREIAESHAVADRLELPLVEVTLDVRRLLDPFAEWGRTHGAALASAGHLLAPLLDRIAVAATFWEPDPPAWGSHPEVDPLWSDGTVAFRHHGADRSRSAKLRDLAAGEPLALRTLRVCWDGDAPRNCGRCEKCIRTTVVLDSVAGDSAGGDSVGGEAAQRCLAQRFEAPPTSQAIRALGSVAVPEFTIDALAAVPASNVAVRAALRSLLPPVRRAPAWCLAAPPTVPMTGAGLAERLAPVLAGHGIDLTDDPADGRAVALGWEAGRLPVRPAHGARHRVRRLVAGAGGRRQPWAVVDLADPAGEGDPGPARLAAAAHDALGPGICYLAGVWGASADPVLPPGSAAALVRAARMRLWWSDGDGVDPLRLVESIEAGCLPIQVVPDDVAAGLRARLPEPLAGIVRTLDDLDGLRGDEVDRLLAPVAAFVLLGSLERDVAALVATGAPLTGGAAA